MSCNDFELALRRFAARFRSDETGSVTVEFVILFPALVMLILTMLWISVVIATLSDVQQLAADLARQSLRFLSRDAEADEVCARLREEIEPILAASMTFIDPNGIRGVACSLDGESGASHVSVTYDMRRLANTSIARMVGWESQEVTRVAMVMP